MADCPTCGQRLIGRGVVRAERAGAGATQRLWECVAARHRWYEWTDDPGALAPWIADWWPRAGTRPDLEADRPPHWS